MAGMSGLPLGVLTVSPCLSSCFSGVTPVRQRREMVLGRCGERVEEARLLEDPRRPLLPVSVKPASLA